MTQIPWSSIVEIMSKSSSKEEMAWYVEQTYQNKWSKGRVTEQFENKAYERKLVEPHVTEIAEKNENH